MLIGRKEIKIFALVIGILGVAGSIHFSGCGSNTSSTPSTIIYGNAMFGPVNGADVKAYLISATTGDVDTSTEPLAKTTTKADGTYNLTIPNSSIPLGVPIGVQVTGGIYTEEGSGATVSLDGQTFKSVLPSVKAGTPVVAAVNAFTDQAFHQFKATVAAGLPPETTPADAAKNANYAMSQALGVTDIMVPPANTQGAIPDDPSGQMATLIASLSALASSTSTSLGTTITSADVAKGMALALAAPEALAAADGGFSKVGKTAVTITRPDGTKLTFTPPPLTGEGRLAQASSDVVAGKIPMANFIPPATLTPPTLTTSPPMTAPANYISGSPVNVPPKPTFTPPPLKPTAPVPGSNEAVTAAQPPEVVSEMQGTCAMAITSANAGTGTSFQGLCADIYLSGTTDKLTAICKNMVQQQFPPATSEQVSLTAVGTYTPKTTSTTTGCVRPPNATQVGTCTTGNLGMKIHFYSSGSTSAPWTNIVTGASTKCTGIAGTWTNSG